MKVVCLSLSLVSTAYGMKTLNNFSYKPWVVSVALATIGTKMGKIGNKKIEKALEVYNQYFFVETRCLASFS